MDNNPDYQVYVWISSEFVSRQDKRRIKLWSSSNGVVFRCGDKVVERYGLWNEFYFELSEKRYAASSDMLRFAVLYEEGGIYLDTDVIFGPSLGDLHAPLGALFVYTAKEDILGAFLPHVIASKPAHPLFPLISSRIRSNYSILRQQKDVSWRYTDTPEWRYTATLSLTGEVITPACFQVTGLLELTLRINTHLKKMEFPLELEHVEDHSWIECSRLKEHVHPSEFLHDVHVDIKQKSKIKYFSVQDLYDKYQLKC